MWRRTRPSWPASTGQSFYGIVERERLRLSAATRPAGRLAFDVRPLGPIYPNKTPRMETWRRRTGKAAFHLTMLERQALVFNNSYAEFSKL